MTEIDDRETGFIWPEDLARESQTVVCETYTTGLSDRSLFAVVNGSDHATIECDASVVLSLGDMA